MGNLIDYLAWRGDIPFSTLPLNDLDAAILSALAYIDFSRVLTERDTLPFSSAIKKLKEKEKPHFLALDDPLKEEQYNDFLNAVLESKRFKDLTLHDYVDIHDEKETTQFAAMSFTLEKGEEAVVYRGTDETLVGWKEDCMLSFMEAPCQRRALSYLISILSNSKKVHVMGHSKGSNLALYASLYITDKELKKVDGIYLFDGPGLCRDVFPEVETHRIDNKVHVFEPEFDVVAKIFEINFSNTTIVKSDEQGIMCHGILSWQVVDGKFVTCSVNDPEALWIQNTINSLAKNLTPKERESFVNTLFDALTKNGEKTVFDFKKNPVFVLERVLVKTFHATRRNKKATRKIGFSLVFGTGFEDLKSIKKISEFFFTNIFYGLVMIVSGILFVSVPKSALPIASMTILSAFFAFELGLNIYYLAKSKWNWKQQKLRLLFFLFGIVLYGALWGRDGNITYFANWLFGIFFLLFGIWMTLSLDQNRKKSLFDFVWNILEISLYVVVGCYFLYSPEQFLPYGTFVTGCILIVDGAMKIIR